MEGDKPQPYTGKIVETGDGAKPEPYTGAVKQQLEFPDAPSTGRMPLPGIAMPWSKEGKDIEGNQGVSIGDKASTLFGTLMTDSAKARQEIYAKHLPGAKAVDDKYGNPMIEYRGVKYYTARPGEFDAMDAGRVAAATSMTVPAMAIAPATATGAALASGVTMGIQSLSEDALTQAAGGESQKIDATKAGLSAIISTLIPLGLGKAALPLAGRLYAAVRSGTPLTDEALVKLGLSAEQVSSLTPELRDTITTAARRTFGNPTAVGSTYRTGLGKEAGVDLTRGEISGNPGQIKTEQVLADTPGGPGQQTMQNKRAAQEQQLSDAQLALRAKVGNGPPLRPDQAGVILRGKRDTGFDLTGQNVDQLYGLARDPAAVEAAGGTMAVPATHASQFGRVTRDALATDNVGRIALGEEAGALTPNAKGALEAVDRWSQRAVGPRVDLSKSGGPTGTIYNPEGGLLGPHPPGTTSTRVAIDQPGTVTRFPDISWQKAEDLRQTLVGFQKQAQKSGSKQDQDAVAQIIKSFDDHFGPLNPLYAPARDAHAERMSTFKPGGSSDQDSATKAVLKALDGPEPGAAVMNTIFGPKVSKGEAVQMIDHLNEKVFATQPEARDVIKEQALRRLQVDDKGFALSPQRTATAMKNALEGDAERPIYDRLFSGPELAELRRRYELVRVLANSRTPINPPRSGLLTMATLKQLGGMTSGAVVGEHLGNMIGMPGVGTAVGATAAGTVGPVISRVQAARAVSPPANYGVQGLLGKPLMGAGQAAGQAGQQGLLGPADRLMQSAWGVGGSP